MIKAAIAGPGRWGQNLVTSVQKSSAKPGDFIGNFVPSWLHGENPSQPTPLVRRSRER